MNFYSNDNHNYKRYYGPDTPAEHVEFFALMVLQKAQRNSAENQAENKPEDESPSSIPALRSNANGVFSLSFWTLLFVGYTSFLGIHLVVLGEYRMLRFP